MNSTTNIREVIALSNQFVLVVGENKKAMILDVGLNQITCSIDLIPDSALLTNHVTSHNENQLVIVSPLVIEFYNCSNGVLEYIGSMSQKAFISHGQSIRVTDVYLRETLVIFSTNIGTFLFFEFPTLCELGVLELTKTPIERFCYASQRGMIYIVDSNRVFVAAEIEPRTLKFIRARVEKELPPSFQSGPVELVPTNTGCLIHCGGSVAEFSLENPALTVFNIQGAYDINSTLRHVYIITSTALVVFLHNDSEPLQTFSLPTRDRAESARIVGDRALLLSTTAISITPLPTIQQAKTEITPTAKYNVVFKSVKMSRESSIVSLMLADNRCVFGLDSKGKFYFAELPKQTPSNVIGIGTIESRGAEYANLVVSENGMYALAAMGFGLNLIHTKTGKVLATSVAPKEPPHDCISALTMHSDNICVFGVGFMNGLVAVMNVENGSFYVAQKHQSTVVKIMFIEETIISLSSDGYLCVNEQLQKVGEDVVSFDIWQRQFCMVVCKMNIKIYSLINWSLLGEWNSMSPIINAKYSCDGNFIIIAARDRCTVLKSHDLSVVLYLSTTTLLGVLKTQGNYQPNVINMDVSRVVPCQFALSFTGGSVMIIEPRNYLEWRN